MIYKLFNGPDVRSAQVPKERHFALFRIFYPTTRRKALEMMGASISFSEWYAHDIEDFFRQGLEITNLKDQN